MIAFLKNLFSKEVSYDNPIEGVAARHYKDETARQDIKARYIKRYTMISTPQTDPLKFDPLDPPSGWAYDPYYEVWIKIQQ